MDKDNEKVQFVEEILSTREAYHEIITKYSFTDSEKDILLQATANIMHSNIDKLLIYEAYEILAPKIQDDIATPKIQHRISIHKKQNGISKLLLSLVAGLIIMVFFLTQYHSIEDEIVDEKVMQERIRNAQKSYGKKLEQKQQGNVHGAWAYMQIFVEKRLKSPKSADFPFGGGTYHTKDLGNGRYEVNSYVDSQNAFGANIRTHFDGTIKRKDGGWILEYLNFRN